jgi:hypothetical protein
MTKKLLALFIVIMFPAAAHAADIPKSYPFNMWSEAYSGSERSLVTGRFEQGVELTEYRGWSLVPYVAVGGSKGSKKEEYWNNEVVPEVGVKISHSFSLTPSGWGSVSIGARKRWEKYSSNLATDRSNSEVFLQLGFGGNWKN